MPYYRFRAMGPFFFSTWKSPRHRVNIKMLFDPLGARDEVFEQAENQQHRIRSGEIQITKIKDAIGLYVIGLKHGSRLVPYYVGQAAKQTIHTRLFQKQDKTAKVQAILNEQPRAKPFVFLFPMVTETGRLARLPRGEGYSAQEKALDLAENMMIGHAMHTNPWLHNIAGAVALDSFVIDGSPQAKGTETDFAKAYRAMMGFTKPVRDAKRIKEAAEAAEQSNEAEVDAIVEEAFSHPDGLVPEITPEEAARESEETIDELLDEADESKSKSRGLDAAE